MKISSNKCNVLYLGNNNPKHEYRIDNHSIPSDFDYVRDLGVLVSNDLSSSDHCNYIIKKARRISNLLLRSFVSKNKELLVRAFKTYVRPILEYSSVVWNPHLLCDINSVEQVQRSFTKRLFLNKNITYDERLSLLKLERLELRRIKNDLHAA